MNLEVPKGRADELARFNSPRGKVTHGLPECQIQTALAFKNHCLTKSSPRIRHERTKRLLQSLEPKFQTKVIHPPRADSGPGANDGGERSAIPIQFCEMARLG